MLFEMVCLLTYDALAARVTLPSRQTARKYLSSVSFMAA